MSSPDEQLARPLDPAALDRLWDAMNRGIAPVAGREESASTEAAATILQLRRRDDAPSLDPGGQAAIWQSIAAATLDLERPATANASATSALATSGRLLRSAIRQIAIGMIGGMLVGIVVLGGGLRVLMRLAAMLTDTGGNRMMTENGNVVGQVTLDGTLALLVFTGALFGAMGGVIVMMVRPWLPSGGWLRYTLTGIIGFALAGSTVLDRGDNSDYRRFGIFGLNVCLFTILPFLFGIAVLPVLDWLDRRIPRNLPGAGLNWRSVISSAALIFLALPIFLIVPAALHIPPLGLILALPLVKVATDRWSGQAATRALQRQRERWGLQFGRVALAIPSLIGLLLIVQAIGRLTT